MKINQKRKMPSAKDIFIFWESRFHLNDLECDEKSCFACGINSKIHRAHIKPKFYGGGSDDVKNIHLLCPGCHVETEFMWGGAYWRWIIRKNKKDYKHGMWRAKDKLEQIGYSLKIINRMSKNKKQEDIIKYLIEKTQGGLSDKKFIKKFHINDKNLKSVL